MAVIARERAVHLLHARRQPARQEPPQDVVETGEHRLPPEEQHHRPQKQRAAGDRDQDQRLMDPAAPDSQSADGENDRTEQPGETLQENRPEREATVAQAAVQIVGLCRVAAHGAGEKHVQEQADHVVAEQARHRHVRVFGGEKQLPAVGRQEPGRSRSRPRPTA
jgi:hypothetical protein